MLIDCGVINLQISMTKYIGFQYSVTYSTAVTRTEVTLCWCNQCETVQLLTLTSDFLAPALWPAKSPDLKPLDYRISSNLQERLSQPYSWRWPVEVAPDQEWTIPTPSHQWSGQAVASTSSSLHSSTWRTFWTQTFSMSDICTNVHFDSLSGCL